MQLTVVVVLVAVSEVATGASAWRGENPDYLIERWSSSDGLPENCALGVAQTPDGYLWVGSQNGLMRFNGRNFSPAAEQFGCAALGSMVDA
jgi:ligand-binding sensor domain-containing protein